VGERTIKRPYYYIFPELDELREWWDEKFGGTHTWPKIEVLEKVKKKEEILPF